MYKEEGLKGYMKGNGINCARIFPYSAIQFTSYGAFKNVRCEISVAARSPDACSSLALGRARLNCQPLCGLRLVLLLVSALSVRRACPGDRY